MTTMPPWTFSHLDSFTTCPRKFYEIRVARTVIDPPNVHNEWGDKVHKALEARGRDGILLPEGMQQWEPVAAKILALPGEKKWEQKYALDSSFNPTEWHLAWTRGIADVDITSGSTGGVFDWKTGKRKLTDQLRLYAAYKFASQPQLEVVHTGFVWLKDRKIDKETVTRAEVPAIWGKFLPTVRKLELAYQRDSWPARPNGLCRNYCPCTGCPHNGRR